jgi:hypothetical protein
MIIKQRGAAIVTEGAVWEIPLKEDRNYEEYTFAGVLIYISRSITST